MIRQRLERASWLMGVAALAVSCGDSPGAGTPGEELEVGPPGVIQLALDSTGCTNLRSWPYDNLKFVISKYKAGAATIVETPPVSEVTKTQTDIEGLCRGIGPGTAVVTTVNLRPWFYQVEAFVLATAGGRPIKLNSENKQNVVVESAASGPAIVAITQAGAISIGLDVSVGAWTP
ncbi:MAG: hypothetical protein HYY84_12265 [Deltaproteobacteria bacterium]|nr:hypothetical protein [Deltaproteobacteria bacterium]